MRLFFYLLFMLPLGALIGYECYPTVVWAVTHWQTYLWMLYGMGGYILLRFIPLFRRNEDFLLTASHELTHTIVGLFFGHKIHSFHVEGSSGAVTHSGRRFGDMFIGLSPYCLPIFTYLFILLRIIGANDMLHIFDIFIGLTLAFHIVGYIEQIHLQQPDIYTRGYVRSFVFIIINWLFNLTIILLVIRTGIVKAVTYLFPRYWDDIQSVYHFLYALIEGWVK